MSVIQRVIILNKPFKIRGYTILQWLILVGSVALAFLVGTKIPQGVKLGNLPAGFIVGLLLVCVAIVFVHSTQVKPITWWRNCFLYKLGLVPSVYLPKREEAQEYPDSSIKEPVKREDLSYVAVEHFSDDEASPGDSYRLNDRR
jgi:hypothetical protein